MTGPLRPGERVRTRGTGYGCWPAGLRHGLEPASHHGGILNRKGALWVRPGNLGLGLQSYHVGPILEWDHHSGSAPGCTAAKLLLTGKQVPVEYPSRDISLKFAINPDSGKPFGRCHTFVKDVVDGLTWERSACAADFPDYRFNRQFVVDQLQNGTWIIGIRPGSPIDQLVARQDS